MGTSKQNLRALTIGAVGVVYGDIGTSPLYTMKEIFSHEYGLALTRENLLGVVSMIVWGLIVIVSLKYITLVMRANNRGEGGIMALLALALSAIKPDSIWRTLVVLVGLGGAALFFGDGVITPAISVLSAMEGLEVATPAFKHYVMPLTIGVVVALYVVQRWGTAGIGKFFGPIMLIWFAALAAMGLVNIVEEPGILAAINPLHAIRFLLLGNHWLAFVALGGIVLAFTGAEALYADMGHFGAKPIRVAWSFIVFPSLALSYLGQGALLLADADAVSNPFFRQLGPWSVFPLVILSTVAAVIASQATISGTYSLVQQAVSLDFFPRMKVRHTSEHEMGQVYLPLVNWVQMAAVVLAVVGFRSSSNLASAYGIAVTGTMLATTILTFVVIRYKWHYPLLLCLASTGFFLAIDIALFSSNALKILSGGWFPLVLGGGMLTVMLTWNSGRRLVYSHLAKHALPIDDFLQSLFVRPPHRVEGTAIFFRVPGDGVPQAMLHNLAHNKVLHKRTVFMTVYGVDIPTVEDEDRIVVQDLGHHCYQIDVKYGFLEERDLPRVLALCADHGLRFDMMQTSFFIARLTVIPTPGAGLAPWREWMFATMARNARDIADYFRLPANRVIELGMQVEI